MPPQKEKYLGNTFDQTLSMIDKVCALCKSLYFEINQSNQKLLVTLMVSLVLSKVDYDNALLSGLSLDKLYIISYKELKTMLLK